MSTSSFNNFIAWTAPIIFIVTFVISYLNARQSSDIMTLISIILMIACAVLPMRYPIASHQAWSLINLFAILLCIYGYTLRLQSSSPYAGFGIVVFFPVALIVTISMLLQPLIALWKK